MSIHFNASSMTWFGMEGQTLDITILFAGLDCFVINCNC